MKNMYSCTRQVTSFSEPRRQNKANVTKCAYLEDEVHEKSYDERHIET